MNKSEIQIFKAQDGTTEIQVKLDNDTVWLNLMQLTELFQRDKSFISRHINNIFNEKELNMEATVANFATVQYEGERQVERNIEFFNLDVIISVGYRKKSQRGTQFRIWANKILKDYLIKGFSINEQRLRQQNEQLRELQESVKLLLQLPAHSVFAILDIETNRGKFVADFIRSCPVFVGFGIQAKFHQQINYFI